MDKSIFSEREAASKNIVLELIVDGFNSTYIVRDITDDATVNEFDCDMSRGWESMRYAYADAARYYNSLVPDADAIPLF